MTGIHITGRSLYLRTVTKDSREQFLLRERFEPQSLIISKAQRPGETGGCIDPTVFCRTTLRSWSESCPPYRHKVELQDNLQLSEGVERKQRAGDKSS
jgi:hypothetical protein